MKKVILATAIFLFHCSLKSQSISITSLEEKTVLVNDFNILDRFNNSSIINKIGNPSEIIDGGSEQMEEFGYQTYEYHYGESYIIFRNNLISDVFIFDNNLDINGIKLGDSITIVKSEFPKYNIIGDYLKIYYGNFTISFSFDENDNVSEITYYVPL